MSLNVYYKDENKGLNDFQEAYELSNTPFPYHIASL